MSFQFLRMQVAINRVSEHYRFIFPSAIALPVHQKRMAVIQERLRVLSIVLALCIPAWSVLDFFAFSSELWLSLLKARLLTAGAIVVFLVPGKSLRKEAVQSLWGIYVQLGIIFVIPTLLYVFCTGVPAPVTESTAFAVAITNSYYLFPFVILAGIGFFPLTLLESISIVMPFLTAYYLTNGSPEIARWSAELGMMWSMILLAVISVVISASQLGMLIQLVAYSSYDLLTNCLGRRSGEEIVKAMWHYSKRKKSNLSIAFIDLDRFKLVNDCFGHQVGDDVLANAAATIKGKLRESDFVIRWGGEEFLVLLPDANIEDATNVFARMAKDGFGVRPDGSVQTVSIGLAERMNENSDDKNRLIEIADERLYQAKISGRSRIVGAKTVVLKA